MIRRTYPMPVGVWASFLLLLVVGGGCQRSTGVDGGRTSESGARFLLSREPAGAQSVGNVRAMLEEKKAVADVVVVGRIGGLSQPTWDPERAAFMVGDLLLATGEEAPSAEHDETPKHDAENCPFCRRQQKKELAGLALVEVVDADGSIPPMDARQLLGLEEGQTIVVRGQAEVDGLGALVVRTSSIYVRP